MVLVFCMKDKDSGARFNIKTVFPRYGIPILKIRRSWDRLIFNIGIPILVRWHLNNEMAPRYPSQSITWLLMMWWSKEPGHQQPWYWLCLRNTYSSFTRKYFNYMDHSNMGEMIQKQKYMYVSSKQFKTRRVNLVSCLTLTMYRQTIPSTFCCQTNLILLTWLFYLSSSQIQVYFKFRQCRHKFHPFVK